MGEVQDAVLAARVYLNFEAGEINGWVVKLTKRSKSGRLPVLSKCVGRFERKRSMGLQNYCTSALLYFS